MAKIKIDMELLCQVFPEARTLGDLPRKKKKALKKKISRRLVDIALAEAELYIYNKTYGSLIEELQKVSSALEDLKEKEEI